MATDFESFVAERKRPLLRFAMVLTGDARLTEDIVADVLGKAYERWDRVGEVDDPNAYVRRMIVNEFVSFRRRLARTFPVAEPDPVETSPDPATSHAERAALIVELAKLPRKQRAALVLRYYEGMDDHAIAKLLGCSESTVRSNAARALTRLRGEITESRAQTLTEEVR